MASATKKSATKKSARSGRPAPIGDRLGSPGTGVLVTGGGSGIGRATALALAEVGRPVAIWDINAEGAEETASLCHAAGVAAEWTAIDVADSAAIAAAVPKSVRRSGPSVGSSTPPVWAARCPWTSSTTSCGIRCST
ncbi:MAG: SDR family NAD(P)-dependent oxidoreductase [Acidimicrobiales bacterium]